MQALVLTYNVMQVARITCEIIFIVLIISKSMKNTYLNNYLQHLIPVFIFEQLLSFSGTILSEMNVNIEHPSILLRISEIIRIVISLSLSYPICVFIKDAELKTKKISMYIAGLTIIGILADVLEYKTMRPGVNYLAFLLISIFTLYQYEQLRRRIDEEISRVKNLMTTETILIILNILLVLLFFKNTEEIQLFVTIEIVIRFIQLQKFYTMIVMITQFNSLIPQDPFVLHISSDLI